MYFSFVLVDISVAVVAKESNGHGEFCWFFRGILVDFLPKTLHYIRSIFFYKKLGLN